MSDSNNLPDLAPAPRPIRFVNSQGQPPVKRRRITAACLTCRRRKTRCAGERPFCSTCTKNKHECLGYPEDAKKDSGSSEKHAFADAHERHGDNGPSKRSKKLRQMSIASHDSSRIPRVPPSATSSNSNIYVKTDDDDDDDADDQKAMQHGSQAPPPPQPWAAKGPPGSPTAMRRTESHRIPYFRYFGPTAIVPGFKQMVVSVRDRRRSTGGSGAPASPLSTHSGALASSSAAGSDVVPEDLPIYDPNDPAPVHKLTIHLIKTFFVRMGSNYPFLKQAKFLRLVKEKRVEAILVDAVCSLSARFSDAPTLNGGNDKTPRTEKGAVFAQRARQATVDTFPCPSVGAIQAFLLMAYEGFGANQDSALWMYLGMAIRMAVDLGLEKEVGVQYHGEKDPWYTQNRNRAGDTGSPEEARSDADALSPQEQHEVVQERIDTFWAIFILDRVIASGTGRPVTFRDGDFELSFPELTIDPATNWPDPFPAFLQIINFYGRVSDVLNKIQGAHDLTQEKWDKLGAMESQLTRMYNDWDPRLQFNVANFKAYLSFDQGTTFILLHFWFHALFIILHQPTILTPFVELRSELQLLPDSRQLSMSSAKTICDILSFADLIDPKSFIGNPFTSQPIYIAACAFLLESNANSSKSPSRHASPSQPITSEPAKPSNENSGDGKSSRHFLLASAANQNYQRCYNSLQQVHLYWGGVKYILTALDQKAKGIWDVETYTSEEYESTKTARRDSRSSVASQLSRFEAHSPQKSGPPIAWSLAGTANSPNSSLTLMYQNQKCGTNSGSQATPAVPRQPIPSPIGTPYDPGAMFPPAYPQPNTSAVRHSPRPPMPPMSSAEGSSSRPTVKFDPLLEAPHVMKALMDPLFSPPTQQTPYPTLGPNPPSSLVDHGTPIPTEALAGAHVSGPAAVANSMYFQPAQGGPYQTPWSNTMGNMDAITFDSQEIDLSGLGLQQPDMLGNWLQYIPQDVLTLFENPDVAHGQDAHQG